MNDVIKIGENEKTMSSLEIAKLTGKRHKDVLESIRKMEPSWKNVTGRTFTLSNYKDSTNRTLPCYELKKRECLYIATKFNDEARAKLILRWESLETGMATPAVAQAPKNGAEMLLLYAQQMVEQERRLAEIERRQEEVENRINGSVEYSTIVGFANRYGVNVTLERASQLGRVATTICQQYEFETGRVPDPRFGSVKTYPDSVLVETFEKYYPNIRFK